MKRIFTLLVLTLTLACSSFSQNSHINYDKDSRWFFGINGGATWHTRTEVDNVIKGGYGFTFGHSFGMRPEKLFSWDLRFRYLHGWWGGQATSHFNLDSTTTVSPGYGGSLQTYQDSLGYYIPNFRSQLLSGSIELALNTNRLRENTGWNIQIFGGIGVKGYNTKADLTDGSGNIYDYDNVSANTVSGLLSAQDGNYETDVTGTDSQFEVDWMPSFGAGISYQIAPWVSLGISHKMTWVRNNNLFDITPNDVGGVATGLNDIYHYSSAGFKFHLFGGNHTVIEEDPDETTDINNFDKPDTTTTITPLINSTPRQKPIVDIYDPGTSPYITENNQFVIKANVHYVDGKQNITFKQNGNINNNFSYSASSDKFQSTVVLQNGQNIFEITGVNSAGQDYESTIIIYKREVPTPQPPIVTITNPPYSPYTTNNNTFSLSSTVLNVDSKSQIKVYFNGTYMSNFTYNTSTKNLYATLNLLEGTNTVTVTATNNAGSDSKTVKIIYDKPQEIQPPVVNYIFPATNPYATNQQAINITATVLNVVSKNDIKVVINGNNSTNFTFNTNTKHVNFNMSLIAGANIVEITGTNQAGSDYEATTIIYRRPETPKPPIVTFIDPAVDPTAVYNSNYNVTAKVLYVNSASDIKLKINGVQSYNFAYSASSKMMTFSTNLLVGSNVIEITGTNNVGQDVETTTIIRKRTVVQAPPIVNITYPGQNNLAFNTPNITVVASVLNVSSAANITVFVNGNQTVGFNYNISTKMLTLPIVMNEGVNTVKITGTNNAGSDTDTRLIIYKKPVVPAPPTVAYVNPPTTPHLVTVENFTMTANTTNIDTKSQISLLFNGVLVSDALYTFNSNHQIVFNTDLLQGNNIFNITVTNNDGSADAMAIVTYKPINTPCLIPTVGYIHPVPYSTVNNPNVTIDAQINNHSPETVVELLVNGASQGFMVYNGTTSIASKATVLNEGSNAITVIATNNCGQNQATFTLNYVAPEAPCVDPTFTSVGANTYTTQNSTATVQAGVTEITSATGISATLNGQSITTVFDQGTGTVSIVDAALTLGNNTIILTATNDCGTATLTYHILREECKLPVIQSISPATNTSTTDQSVNLSAQIANVSASEIQLIINGISQPFLYNAQTGILTSSISLNIGSNQVSILAVNSCGRTTKALVFNREIPCEAIAVNLLTPPTEQAVVTNANYSILLHTSGTLNANGVSATLNGANVTTAFDQVSGDVNIANLTLVDGTNTIVVSLTNDCSSKTITYTIDYDGCQPPTININGLTSGSVVNNAIINLSAIVQNSNGAANISVTLNGQNQSVNFDDLTNTLSSALVLSEGSNTIVITVNGCETITQSINITYEVPCQPISYTLMQPSALTQTVVDASYSVTLSIQGVDNPQQIIASLNGTTAVFNFDPITNILTISNLVLVNGTNTIVVTASNACSSETITYTVQYNGCQPPVLNLTSSTATQSTATYSLSATVTNIATQSEIQILHNGAPITFVYNANSGAISGDITLTEGSNSIVITANGCAMDTESFTVNYEIPCDPIVYALSTPAQASISVADEAFALSLVAQFANSNSISVKLNGATVPHTYANDIISSNLTLVDGSNTIVVSMSNDCSTESVTITILYDGCDAPVIDLTGNTDVATTAAHSFVAHISNIDNQNQIAFTLNGATTSFTYNPATDELTAQLSLTEGANAIAITANGCASATDTYSINHTIPCVPVSYSLASPSQLSSVVETASTNITLNVQNVENTAAISATLNGATTTVNYANNIVTLSNLNLIEGANVVVITFGNACSSETLTYTIESDQCDSPVISVTNNNVVTNDPLYTFSCTVTNIGNANNITVAINGQTVSSNYNQASGVVTAQMSLQEGPNSVVVTANGCKSVSVTYNLTYEIACDPITFTHVSPTNTDTVFVASASFSAQINAINVTQQDISATMNGASISSTFSAGLIAVSTSSLQIGLNTFVINMTNACSQSQATFYVVYEEEIEECIPPVITITNTNGAVANDTYTFTASITNVNAAGVHLNLNGQLVPSTFNNGVVSSTVTLIEGANTFTLEAIGCKTSIQNWTVTYTAPAPEPCGPRFNPGNSEWEFCLITPQGTFNRDNLANDAYFNYSGPATSVYFKPIAGGGNAIVNGQDYAVQNGQYYLFEGSLTVDVSSTHPGSMGHWEICITSNANPTHGNGNNKPVSPCDAGKTSNGSNLTPVIKMSSPKQATSTYTNASSKYTFKSSITNVEGNGVIHLTLNGTRIQNISYDKTTKLMSTSLNLREGSNSIKVEATNGDKTTSQDFIINYTKPVEKIVAKQPTITNINPINTSTTSKTASFNFKAKVNDVDSKADIKVYVNGKSTTGFAYTSSTKQLSLVVKLIAGNNTVRVVASNQDKKAERTYTIKYVQTQVEKPAPKIINVNPTTTSVKSATQTFSFKAKVQNVNAKSEIKLMLNGINLPTFTYSTGNNQVSAVLRLKTGSNTIKLEANVAGKKVNRIYTITYSPKVVNDGGNIKPTSSLAPTISNIAPNGKTATSTTATYMFKVKLTNVKSKTGVSMLLNGRSFSGFSYSSSTGQVTAVLKLVSGNNTVKVTAKNGDKSATSTYSITYKPKVIKNTNNGKTTNGGTKTTNGGTKTTNGGIKTTNGGTKTTNGGTKTTNGGTKTTNGGIKTTNGGTKTTNGGTKTTNGGTKTTNGGIKTTNGGTKTTNGGTKTTNGGTKTTNGTSRSGGF